MKLKLLYTFLLLVLLQTSGFGQVTKTWIGTTGGNWNTAGNWSPSGVPGSTDHVLISADQSAIITRSGTASGDIITLKGLTINGNVNFYFDAGSGNFCTLNITDTFIVVSAKTFTVGINNSGRLNITLASTATGTVDGTVFMNSYNMGNSYNRSFTNNGNLAVSSSGLITGQHNSQFILSSGATLQIGSTAGITTTGATGNIQVTGTRTYSTSANYIYNGLAAQAVGNGLPATVSNLTINNSVGDVTLAQATTISNTLTIGSSGKFATANNGLTLQGNFVNNGTFTAGSSAITITGTAATQSIAGFSTTGTVSMTKTGGTATLQGNVGGAGLTMNGNGGTLNLGTGLTHTFTGNWTRTNGTLDGGSSILKIGGTFSGTGGAFTANAGTVDWNAAGTQTIAVVTYNNLTLSGTSLKTFATAPTVNGILSLEGAASVTVTTGVVNYGANATLQYNKPGASPYTATLKEWPATFSGTGGIIIAGTGTITLAASKTISTLNILAGAKLDLGSFTTHTATTIKLASITALGTSWGSLASTAMNKSDFFFLSTATGKINNASAPTCTTGYWTGSTSDDWNVTTNWCGGTIPLSSTDVVIPAWVTNMPVIKAGTTASVKNLTISASATLTVVSDATSLLNISGNFVNNGTFNAGTLSTTTFSGTAQLVATGTYGNLTLSGSGTKSFPSTALAINNKLTINTGVVANLGTAVHNAFALTLGGIGPLFGTWGSTASNPTATNTIDTYFAATTGKINVTSPSVDSLIDNNFASYGTTGAVGYTVGEYTGPLTLTAPNGKVFINTKFASYGTPIGTFPNFTIGTCHALGSRDITIGLLGNTTGTIGTGGFNSIFPDPCYGTSKNYSIVATYGDPVCSGSSPGLIDGSTPTGGAVGSPYTYVWEVSTTSPSSGYSVIPGETNEDYTPGNLTTTTYYRRTVTSGGYSDATIVIVPVISAPSSAPVISSTCSGSTLTVVASSTPGTYVEWYSSCGGAAIATGNTFNPSSAGTYYARYKNICGSSTCSTGVAGSLGYPITITDASTTPICASTSIANTDLTYTIGTGTASTYSVLWNNSTPTNFLLNIVDRAITSPIVLNIPANTPVGIFSGTLTVKDAGGCLSQGKTFTLIISEGASIPSATPTVCQNSPLTAITHSTIGITGITSGSGVSGANGLPTGVSATYSSNTITITGTPTVAGTYNYSIPLTGSTCSGTAATGVIIVKSVPGLLTQGTTTTPTCTVRTAGSVELTGLPTSGSWTLKQDGTAKLSTSGGTGSYTVTGLAEGTYNFTVNNGFCTSANSAVVISMPSVTWNGSWSGTPNDNTKKIIFTTNYNPITPIDLVGCYCKVNPGVAVVIQGGKVLNLQNELIVDPTSSLTFENGASLVQAINDNTVNSGDIIYKRNTSLVSDFDYVYWGTPVKDQQLDVLSPSSDKYYSYWNGAWVLENKANKMNPRKGYIIRVPRMYTTYSQAVQFVGVPNNGEFDVDVVNVKGNLLGNPYPSAIDADDFMTESRNSPNINGGLYFWTHNTKRYQDPGNSNRYIYSASDYAVYNLTGSSWTGATSSGGVSNPGGEIAACQSFFVPTNLPTGKLYFTNSMRIKTAGKNSEFFKPSNTKKTAAVQKNRVWLNLTNDGGAFKQVLVGYITGATNGIDNLYDAETMNGNAFVDFYSVNDSKKFTIQGRRLPFETADEVPLGYQTTVAGTFQISIDNVDGALTGQSIYLEDKTTNTIHDLRSGVYSFNTEIGTFNDRFVLRYTDTSKLGIDEVATAKGKGIIVSVKNHQIKVNSFDQTISSIMIYDLKGSLLYENKKVGKNEFTVDHLTAADQFMIVTTQLDNGKWISEEIIFHD